MGAALWASYANRSSEVKPLRYREIVKGRAHASAAALQTLQQSKIRDLFPALVRPQGASWGLWFHLRIPWSNHRVGSARKRGGRLRSSGVKATPPETQLLK